MTAPMAGIRVLDLTSVLFGPYCTMLLGDMGADVIKIEAPAGDTTRKTGPGHNPGMAAFFLVCNRNKRSICLDLKHEDAREALWRLVDGADVFIHSIRPQALRRLGFGPEAVRARNPRIVYAGLHGFSEQGPYAGRPAYDDIIQGGSGLAALMEPLAGEPRFTPMVAADKTCGLMATWAVVAALLHRERTGEGQVLEVPMFEAMAHFNTIEHLYGHVFDPPLAPMGYPRVLARWRKPYPTADGHLNVL
ncbi:MAG: CoA transferase, partial [Alphaproteobacteria bacterium]|nr:CoA transferase [Alphaproteobacteria bacterium]